MRGSDAKSGSLFSYVDLDQRVPAKHPLRVIKALADDVLVSIDAEFERLYEGTGRQSIAPERLLRASLLQAFYSVRSERQLMERSTTTCCFAGSSASASTMPYGTIRRSRRTAIAFSTPMLPPSSSKPYCATPR